MPPQAFHTALLLAPEPFLRRTLKQLLRAAGVARVLEGATAAEGLSCLSADLVQLVLTPWELPDLAGRALLLALRNRGRNREVPVVLLDTGLAQANVIAAVKAGAAGRLTLPAQSQALRALLEQIARNEAGTGAERPTEPMHAGRHRPPLPGS